MVSLFFLPHIPPVFYTVRYCLPKGKGGLRWTQFLFLPAKLADGGIKICSSQRAVPPIWCRRCRLECDLAVNQRSAPWSRDHERKLSKQTERRGASFDRSARQGYHRIRRQAAESAPFKDLESSLLQLQTIDFLRGRDEIASAVVHPADRRRCCTVVHRPARLSPWVIGLGSFHCGGVPGGPRRGGRFRRLLCQ